MGSGHVHDIGVSVPYQLNGCERMIPSEIAITNARPMIGEIPMVAGNLNFLNREYSAAAKNRYSFCLYACDLRRRRGLRFVALEPRPLRRSNMPGTLHRQGPRSGR